MLVVIPGKRANQRHVVVAVVTSVWKSQKKPKLVTAPCPLSHVVAFRCVQMEPLKQSISAFEAKDSSTPWVLKPEALIAVLATAEVEGFHMGIDSLQVRLSSESVEILDRATSAAEWWPAPLPDGEDEVGGSGLYKSRGRGRRAKNPKKQAKSAARIQRNNPGKVRRDQRGQKKDPVERGAVLLKNATNEEPLEFCQANCKRTGVGSRLVCQMMVRFKHLEEENFKDYTQSFNVDELCVVRHETCKGMQWKEVVSGAHSFLCAEFLAWPLLFLEFFGWV